MNALSCHLSLTISLTPSNYDTSPSVTMNVMIRTVDPTIHGNLSLEPDFHFDAHGVIL